MKRLFLIRHAKAELIDYKITDFERNLKKRGITDSKLISRKLKDCRIYPDLIISSKASRARQTAQIFAKTLGYPKEDIDFQDFLYDGFTTQEFLDMLREKDKLSTNYQSIMIFGHNPSIEHLASVLISNFNKNIPTCAVVGINFKIDYWKDIEVRQGILEIYDFPHKHKTNN